MKIYSEAYAHAPVLSDHLQRAKLTLINEPKDKLHRVINRAAVQSGAKLINVVKGKLGLKASTPLPIQALSDLYHQQLGTKDGVKASAPSDPWAAARLFADSRPNAGAMLPSKSLLARKERTSTAAAKTVRFATLPPSYKTPQQDSFFAPR